MRKRKRFTQEQIITVLREHEACAKAGDLARQHGVCEATLYNCKAKYGGMDVSDAKRLKALGGPEPVHFSGQFAFVWTAGPDKIIAAVKRGDTKRRIQSTGWD